VCWRLRPNVAVHAYCQRHGLVLRLRKTLDLHSDRHNRTNFEMQSVYVHVCVIYFVVLNERQSPIGLLPASGWIQQRNEPISLSQNRRILPRPFQCWVRQCSSKHCGCILARTVFRTWIRSEIYSFSFAKILGHETSSY
jgi:hypothetical protein